MAKKIATKVTSKTTKKSTKKSTKKKLWTEIISSPEVKALVSSGLSIVSTDLQRANLTVDLRGTINNESISYLITASGRVFSNRHLVQRVVAKPSLRRYRAQAKIAGNVLAKRISKVS